MAQASLDWPSLLREFREARGLKQEAAAAHLGVSQATISRWESGAGLPSVAMRNRLFGELRRIWSSPDRLRWASTFQRLPIPGAVVSDDRVAQVVTDHLAAKIGVPRAELEGLPISDLFEGEILDLAELVRAEGGFQGRVVSAEACLRVSVNRQISSSASFFIHFINWPHFTEDGRIVRVNQGSFLSREQAQGIREGLGGSFRLDLMR